MPDNIFGPQVPPKLVVDEVDIIIDPGMLEGKQPLGEGSYGKVHKSELCGTPVAVKVFTDCSIKITDILEEIKTMRAVCNPNIVQLIGVTQEPLSLVTEFIPGGDLDSWLQKHSPNNKKRIAMSLDITSGLMWLHSRKVIHRDIKPPNLLVTSEGRVKLADFGLAQLVISKSKKSTSTVKGSPGYMAPELLMPHKIAMTFDSLILCDIYSCGMVFWELLTAKPFKEFESQFHNWMSMAFSVSSGTRPEFPSNFQPPEIQTLIESMWNGDPSKRVPLQKVHSTLKTFS